MLEKGNLTGKTINAIVIVAALGYFVDIYDLTLFNIVRIESLKDLHIEGSDLLTQGIFLQNMQMLGMLLGGILWGILGDKKGRLTVLFGTILVYSAANIGNAFIQNITQYAYMRFFAGLGLAGELGAGITLISEVMTKEKRGYGTMMVGFIGILGTVLGFIISKSFGWRNAYIAGGVLGMVLLVLRIYVNESGMFSKLKEQDVKRGDFILLFKDRKRFLKYLYCILLAIPVWYVIGILITFSPEFASGKVFNINGTIIAGQAMVYHYIGASLGSLLWSVLSQWLHSRKKSLWYAIGSLILFGVAYFCSFGLSPFMFYLIIFLLGVSEGYWIIFITVASEQFGTNLRATVTTTTPNFVRGSTILSTNLFRFLSASRGIWQGALFTGIICISLAVFALFKLDETYGKDLDYLEN